MNGQAASILNTGACVRPIAVHQVKWRIRFVGNVPPFGSVIVFITLIVISSIVPGFPGKSLDHPGACIFILPDFHLVHNSIVIYEDGPIVPAIGSNFKADIAGCFIACHAGDPNQIASRRVWHRSGRVGTHSYRCIGRSRGIRWPRCG